jgi:uncharacterized membrane protein YkoI
MCRACFLLAFLALGFVAASGWADDNQSTPKPAAAQEVLADARVDLIKAVDLAQQHVAGGKLLGVRLEKKAAGSRFGAYLLSGDRIKEVEIDTASGKVMESKDAQEESRVGEQPLADAKRAAQLAKINLADAIRTGTERVPGGKPIEAEMRLQGGKAVAEVELLNGAKITVVSVDAADGKAIKVEDRKGK